MKIDLSNYKNRNIHIVGVAGAEGSALAEFLASRVPSSSITAHDFSADEEEFSGNFNKTHLSLKPAEREAALQKLRALPVTFHFRDTYLQDIHKADIVFVSQVWFKYAANAPLHRLRSRGVTFKTITNLYFELAPCPIISVTGSNGKTTTANLLKHILSEWEKNRPGRQFYFAGNDRGNVQVLENLEEMTPQDVLLLETSSTQLVLHSGISPHIGVLTNLSPNHLDDHGTFAKYIAAKEEMFNYQKPEDFAVVNFDNAPARELGERHRRNVFYFSSVSELERGVFIRAEVAFLKNSESPALELFHQSDLKIFGEHNLQNALAAAAAAYLFGATQEEIHAGVSAYPGIKHRLKLLYNLGGIRYVDDTQATTPEATIAGLRAFQEDIFLLAGGDNKGMEYAELGKIINQKAKALILLPGDASDAIARAVNKELVRVERVESLAQARELLQSYRQTGFISAPATVLISPAAAHFYSQFVETSGEDLKSWVKSLQIEV